MADLREQHDATTAEFEEQLATAQQRATVAAQETGAAGRAAADATARADKAERELQCATPSSLPCAAQTLSVLTGNPRTCLPITQQAVCTIGRVLT